MKLTVVHDDVDLTLKMDNLTAAATDLALDDLPIYIGYHKPLKHFYAELEANAETNTMEVAYYDGSAFVAIDAEDIEDKTFKFTMSGLVKLPELDHVKTTIASKEMYWIRLTFAPIEAGTEEDPASAGTLGLNGINLVLSNDSDFGFVPNISDYRPAELTSWIGFHQEARNIIVQTIRNSGKAILQRADLVARQVDQFDLLEVEEFRNASKYLALHLIFDYLSKGSDDHYAIKAQRFYERYSDALNSNLMTIDMDDDGEKDEGESSSVQFIGIRRE